MAVVKWGYCGALEERSLCDSFYVTQEQDGNAEKESAETNVDDGQYDGVEAVGPVEEGVHPAEPEGETRAGRYDAMMLDGYGEVIEVLSRGVEVAMGARVRSITCSATYQSGKRGSMSRAHGSF